MPPANAARKTGVFPSFARAETIVAYPHWAMIAGAWEEGASSTFCSGFARGVGGEIGSPTGPIIDMSALSAPAKIV